MGKHYKDGVEYTPDWDIPTDEEQAALALRVGSQMARTKRNALLQETDWMAGSDVTMSDAWKTYRQALRDLPAQSGFPDVDFPTKPS